MKKLLAFGLLMAVLVANSGAGCSGNNSDDPQPQEVKLLVGSLWEVTRTYTSEPGGTITLYVKPGALGFRFRDDGKLESCSHGTCEQIGHWAFELHTKNSGKLTMSIDNQDMQTVYGKKLEGSFSLPDDPNDRDVFSWRILGNPTIGNTDATLMDWYFLRKR